jgi:3-deoxy-D-manno-octulosonic-acid transferase
MLLPLDVGAIVGRVMRTVRPSVLVLVETEIWPALIRGAAQCGVPCVMVSGRISVRAATRYAWVRCLLRAVLPQLRALAMQTNADADRIIALGAPAERVQVVGNLKFARPGPGGDAPAEAAVQLVKDRLLLVAASTHPGEETMVLQACTPLWHAYPELLLLLAPRRPERFEEVSGLLAQADIAAERRSRLRGPVAAATRVLLLDTLGELPDFLALARAVFVGGTMLSVGGHNVLEPALFGKPVAFGPFTENVTAAAEALLQEGAASRVYNAEELGTVWSRMLQQPAVAENMGRRARELVMANVTVAQRTFEIVRRCAAPGK